MIVLDASGSVAYLVDRPPGRGVAIRRGLIPGETLHAPHLLDIEVAHTLRRLVLRGELTAGRATAGIEDLRSMPVVRYPHHLLLPRVWQLRHNLTAYDAVYVALAEALGATLLTLDAGIGKAPGHAATVEVM